MFSSLRKILFSISVFAAGCLSVYGVYWLVIPKTILQKLKYEDHIPLLTQTIEDDEKWREKIQSFASEDSKKTEQKTKIQENKEFKRILDELPFNPENYITEWKEECRRLYNIWLGEDGADEKYKQAEIACTKEKGEK